MGLNSAPLRVLDLTDGLAHQGIRLLVGLGADVIRLEPTGPEPTAAERAHWHAGVRLWRTDALEQELTELLPEADVVIESGPLDGLDTVRLRENDPKAWQHVAHVVVTPFGLTGPRSGWQADDLVVTAAGGMAWLCGDPDGPPEAPPRQQASQLAGTHAAIGALLARLAHLQTGRGQLVDVSAQEAVAATLETGAISWIHGRTVPGRTSGVYTHVAHRVFATADGHVAGGYSGSNRMWDDMLSWLTEEGEAEDLLDERWQDPLVRWEGRPHVDSVVSAFAARRATHALAEEARRRSLPWAEVAAPARLTENPQLRSRGFFVTAEAPEAPDGEVTDVGFPYESPALPRPVRLRAAVKCATRPDWAPRPAVRSTHSELRRGVRQGRGALDGVRVLDLTWVLAGPYVTKTLADHGAEIVKIESRHRQDPTRFSPGMRLRPGASHDESGYFLNFNRNKQSLALNIRSSRGPELLRRLVGEVDVVVENFSPGVLARWGLSYPQLRELNPSVVLVSMAGLGQDGPWQDAVTFADTLAALSGMTFETGRDGRAPQGLAFGLGDMVAANAAVLGTLEALLAGGGRHVDLSQLEAMSAQLGLALVETQLSGPAPVQSLVLRTTGEDRWIAISSAGYHELAAALATVTDASAPSLEDEASWLVRVVADQDADSLAERLQRCGIAAYPVRDGRDLVEKDPQLAARQFYPYLTHPLVGSVAHEGVVAQLSDTPGGLHTPAPLLGEQTDELLTRILGLSPAELTSLHEQGVLE